MAKILVAYFSASGVTQKLAKRLATVVNGDLFEIVPANPYTNEDLDWENSKSRSSVEMSDRSCRPQISSVADNIEQYDVIFVGFPIWWYREPSIIDTFMEMYDFAGKTLVPFATSGSSEIGDSGKNMQALAKGANVVSGKRFDAGVSEDKLADWASQWI